MAWLRPPRRPWRNALPTSRGPTGSSRKEGVYYLFSQGAPFGGTNQICNGLFGMVIVEPRGSTWYRSQVTAAQLEQRTRQRCLGHLRPPVHRLRRNRRGRRPHAQYAQEEDRPAGEGPGLRALSLRPDRDHHRARYRRRPQSLALPFTRPVARPTTRSIPARGSPIANSRSCITT